jgi:hypothetical protein
MVAELEERNCIMTDKINPYAAAPQLMKSWTALSTAW